MNTRNKKFKANTVRTGETLREDEIFEQNDGSEKSKTQLENQLRLDRNHALNQGRSFVLLQISELKQNFKTWGKLKY